MTVEELVNALMGMPSDAEVVVGEGIELLSVFYDDDLEQVCLTEA